MIHGDCQNYCMDSNWILAPFVALVWLVVVRLPPPFESVIGVVLASPPNWVCLYAKLGQLCGSCWLHLAESL